MCCFEYDGNFVFNVFNDDEIGIKTTPGLKCLCRKGSRNKSSEIVLCLKKYCQVETFFVDKSIQTKDIERILNIMFRYPDI